MALNISSGNRYIITNTQTGTVLDLSGTNPAPAILPTAVIGWTQHGGENQQWELILSDKGWLIRNVWMKDQYLSYSGAPDYTILYAMSFGEYPQNGTKLVGSQVPFVWNIWPDKTNITGGRINLPGTTYDVDLSEGNAAPGTTVQLWDRWEPGPNQVWTFEKV